MRYYLVSLGCPKNTVDAQDMGLLLDTAGHQSVSDPSAADVLMVNTCGFIESARTESLQVLRDLATRKRPDQRLVATGCLSQRAGAALARQVRGLDGILGTRRWAEVLSMLSMVEKLDRRKHSRRTITCVGDPPVEGSVREGGGQRRVSRVAVQGRSAYLKIADGCSAPCAFCAIPLIKGPLRSRPAEEIIADARHLAERGMREIILIAQDVTAYGQDRGERDALPGLLDALVLAVPQVPWIRLMYAYPQNVGPRLIETMARHQQVCKYLDLPLQHAHPDMLKRMRRPANVDRVRRLIDELRKAMPGISLRTAFIVGYPGESEVEFCALEDFVQEMQFDKVGVFTYSPEEGTAAYDLPGPVTKAIVEERYDRLMSRQQAISLDRNQAQVGRTLDVLIEGQGEVEYEGPGESPDIGRALGTSTISVGRSYRDAPEIDGLVFIEKQIEPGEMVSVRITGAMEYDLLGVAT